MDVSEYLGALDGEGRRLVSAAAAADLDAAVPGCPGWRLRDLLAHVGFVHRWAAGYVRDARMQMLPGPGEAEMLATAPAGDAVRDWVAQGHAELVRVLTAAPADVRCWTFLPAPSPLAFWARRQAHETAVHRVDAQQAAGQPQTPVDPAFAADGIDELLTGLLARRRPGRATPPGDGAIGLDPADRPESWTVRYRDDRLVAVPGLQDCGVVVRGPAAGLYLALWNRQPLASLDVTGPGELLDWWHDQFRITWT
ncbi:MAG: maleylpyruvate isomerase family mycothiol-dependent enzyme [Streptosporangiaceae bacterium]